MSAIFIDANIPIYAVGREHGLKLASIEVMRLAADKPNGFVTDAEVLQELLHRYVSLRMRVMAREVLRTFAEAMQGRIEPLYASDVQDAATFADRYPALSARDLIHLAVMQRLGVTRIASTDRGFDGIEGVECLDPADFDSWRETVQ